MKLEVVLRCGYVSCILALLLLCFATLQPILLAPSSSLSLSDLETVTLQENFCQFLPPTNNPVFPPVVPYRASHVLPVLPFGAAVKHGSECVRDQSTHQHFLPGVAQVKYEAGFWSWVVNSLRAWLLESNERARFTVLCAVPNSSTVC